MESLNKFSEFGRWGEIHDRSVYKTLEIPDEMSSTVDNNRSVVNEANKRKRSKKRAHDPKGKLNGFKSYVF